MSNSLKAFLILAIFLGFSFIAFAQETIDITEAINLDEDVQPEDLGVSEPWLLPDSPFYFLKNWAREIQQVFTFNPVKRAELRVKFANEKLMEVKKSVELKKNPEIIKKATENYQQEAEKIKNQVEKIKEKAKENPEVEKFLDKFVHQQTLHQKLLQKLETQVPAEAFEKIKEAREVHLENFQGVMLKLEDREEKITEKLDKILEEQKGSEFKNFKNLEVLENLEEKVPEEAKQAIRKAEENALKRLQGDLEKMSPEDQEKFKEYIEKISGEKEKQLQIVENLKIQLKEASATPEMIKLKENLEEMKEKIKEKINEKKGEPVACAEVITYCIDPSTGKCIAYPDACSTPKPCQSCSMASCAKEGEMFSQVYKEFPSHCCEGLIEWYSGMDTRVVKEGKCLETGLVAGAPVGTCIKCGDGICGPKETLCNCPQDCK